MPTASTETTYAIRAAAAPARRAYSTPRLIVHGTLAELTASSAAGALVVSRLTGG